MSSLLFRFKKAFVNAPVAAPETVYEDIRCEQGVNFFELRRQTQAGFTRKNTELLRSVRAVAPGKPGEIGRLRKMKKDTGHNYPISFRFIGTPGPIRTGGLRIRRAGILKCKNAVITSS